MDKLKKIIIILIIIISIITILLLIPKKSKIIYLNKKLGENIYSSNIKEGEIYQKEKHKKISKEIKKLFSLKNTINNPLIIYNAYGTNKLSVNMYFYTLKDTKVTYEISAKDTNKLKKTAYENNYKKHSIQLIGLVAGKTNKIKITLTDKSKKTKTYDFTIKVPKMHTPIVKGIENKDNKKELTDGLFVLFGTLKDDEMIDDLYLVDNEGTIRGKFPLKHNVLLDENNTVDNIKILNNHMYYNVDYNKIVKVNRLGAVVEKYQFSDFNKHHDFTIDEKNNKMIILASENTSATMEDMILIYDLEKKKISNIIDLKNMLEEIYLKANKVKTVYSKNKIDWIHINSIDINNDEIIISSRELSSVISIKNIYKKPTLNYILGPKELYEKTSLKKYVYEKENDFNIHLGQHTAYFNKDQKYISLYNNNFPYSETINWINWNQFSNELKSFYYLYEINDENKSFSLKSKIEVPFSAYMSSSQILNNNIIISSREPKYFGEYDSEGQLIKKYNINQFTYRVNKYTFKDFWFI